MSLNLFEFKDYKAYITNRLELPDMPKGSRSRLAECIHCHSAYISQVLNGGAHFSLEQADLINPFLNHTKEESHFFLLLVQYGRAGTASLKNLFQEEIEQAKDAQFNLKNRLVFKKTLSTEDQATFYSSWQYGAIHVLVSVPGCHTERGISQYLGLPLKRVSEIVHFLVQVGLLERTSDRLKIGTSHIHLGKDSPMISRHHTNWRMQAIQSLERGNDPDLHYSSVITASKDDSLKIKEIMVKAIEQIRSIVKDSKDEESYSYAMDFFGLRKNA